MNKSIFTLTQMDCPSEESLVRMQLEGMDEVKQLTFDLPARQLSVLHTGDVDRIAVAIHQLKLGDSLVSTELTAVSDADLHQDQDGTQRRILRVVLGINLFFFILEMISGIMSHSMGLVADSLDMLADALVYGLSLLAVGGAIWVKKRVAAVSGYLQISLALIGLLEVLRRFLGVDEVPDYSTMILVSLLALLANVISLILLRKVRSDDANIQASQIFTSNDVIINASVIGAGVLVYLSQSKLPDLIIGAIVFVIVMRGAARILQLSR